MASYSDTYAKTRENISSFYQPVEMSGGYTFKHVDTVKRIDSYYYSKFESGMYDSEGYRKFFYNIVKPACDVAVKFIDLDTKDIVLYPTRGDEEFKLWIMQRHLRQWMKDKQFAQFINDIEEHYTRYGHLVIKKDKDNSWKRVNLQNLRLDPSAHLLRESHFIYEILSMNRVELKEMGWGQQTDELLASYPEDTGFIIYECYDLNTSDEGKRWKRSFKTKFLTMKTNQGAIETPESQINQEASYIPGMTLYEDTVDELPYRETKWENVPGRWLGYGIVEYLFDNQIRQNELSNVKSKGMLFSGLHIYQTADDTVDRNNLLLDVRNGDIIKTAAGISPVQNDERNLSVYAQEESRWDLNSNQKTFSFDVARGDTLPSGTPLGVARITAAMVESYYSLKRENLGLFLKQLLIEDVIPSFQKENRKKNILRLFSSDKEIYKLYEAMTEYQTRKTLLDYATKTGTIPSDAAIKMEQYMYKEGLKKKKDIDLEIPEGFYSDVNYGLDITITGEEVDVGAKLQTLQNAMMTIASNPAMLTMPPLRTIFFKALQLAGFSPVELDLIEKQASEVNPQEMMMQQAMAGGGGAAPSQPAAPQQPVTASTSASL